MGSRFLSSATKAWLLCGMAVLHVGLLMVMALPAVRAGPPPTGDAPVINLTLEPSPRMDGQGAAQAAADQTGSTAAAPPPVPAPPELRTPVPPRSTPLETVSLSTPSPMRLSMPSPAPGVATGPRGGAAAPGDSEGEGRAGQTDGGGGREIGAAAAPAEDQYAARVIAWVERRKGSPGGGVSGVVVLRFVLDRQGRLRDAEVVSVQGDRRVGPIALDTLRAAQPFPRPPADTTWRTREFHVRLDYRPRGR